MPFRHGTPEVVPVEGKDGGKAGVGTYEVWRCKKPDSVLRFF